MSNRPKRWIAFGVVTLVLIISIVFLLYGQHNVSIATTANNTAYPPRTFGTPTISTDIVAPLPTTIVTPTSELTATPTPQPTTVTPTPELTATPTPEPIVTPTPQPTVERAPAPDPKSFTISQTGFRFCFVATFGQSNAVLDNNDTTGECDSPPDDPPPSGWPFIQVNYDEQSESHGPINWSVSADNWIHLSSYGKRNWPFRSHMNVNITVSTKHMNVGTYTGEITFTPNISGDNHAAVQLTVKPAPNPTPTPTPKQTRPTPTPSPTHVPKPKPTPQSTPKHRHR